MTDIRIAFVVAMDRNRVIGRAGALPWRIPADLKFFKAVTMGKPVVMGRKTWQSIGRALPGRANIVVSRDPDFRSEGAAAASSLDAALDRARAIARPAGVAEVMVIGGAEIYALALPRADRLYITEVQAEVRSEEHTSELQSLMRNSYAVFCLKKKNAKTQ